MVLCFSLLANCICLIVYSWFEVSRFYLASDWLSKQSILLLFLRLTSTRQAQFPVHFIFLHDQQRCGKLTPDPRAGRHEYSMLDYMVTRRMSGCAPSCRRSGLWTLLEGNITIAAG